MDLSVALMRTALTHYIEHSEFVEKGTDKFAFVDDLHYALEQYFDDNACPMHITDIHELHSALELEGYQLMYSGVSSSVIHDPKRTGLVIRGFELNLPEEDEEDEEDEEEEEEEEEGEENEEEEEVAQIEIDESDLEEEESEDDSRRRRSSSKKDHRKDHKSSKSKSSKSRKSRK
jgi:hypothetical protein